MATLLTSAPSRPPRAAGERERDHSWRDWIKLDDTFLGEVESDSWWSNDFVIISMTHVVGTPEYLKEDETMPLSCLRNEAPHEMAANDSATEGLPGVPAAAAAFIEDMSG